MREILFRALTIHSREWVTGYYCKGQTKHWLLPEFGKIYIDIDPETIGQFTGLKDKNGVDIYEGDILAFEKVKDFKKEFIHHFEVKWEASHSGWTNYSPKEEFHIIGNIHENPELLTP